MINSAVRAAAALCVATTLGCSASDGSGTAGRATGGASGGPAVGGGSGGNLGGQGGGLSVGGQGGASNAGTGGGETCASSTELAQPVEANLFISFDKSGSMDSDNKWKDATQALKSFFQDPGTDGLRVAMRFFGDDLPVGEGCSQFICNLAACANPHVGIGTLLAAPNDPHELSLINAIAARKPGGGGGTPIHPALHGATTWAKSYKASHPADVVVVILVTDGKPEGCIENVGVISGVASDAYANHGIRTYSVGLAGSAESTMNQIASAGGTGKAFFINSGDVTQGLLGALKQIQGEATLPCQFAMPQGASIDPQKVNVEHTPGGSSPQSIGQVDGAASCSSVIDGWYYDDPALPASIVLCPQTCQMVQGDAAARIDIVVGCETVIAPPA
jgi:hypothetical protein